MALQADSFVLQIDERIYDLDCVQRAAAVLSNIASFNFSASVADTITVTVSVRSPSTITSKDAADRLLTEVLDQRLRQRVADETKTERDLVLAYAFSNSKIIG
jgi:hypothetical protein